MSTTTFNLLVIGGGLIVVAIVTYLALRTQKKREQMLAEAAGRLGARFDPKPDTGFAVELRDVFWVLRYLRTRGVTNLIERPGADATLRLFDYAYLRPGSRSPSYWSVLLLASTRLDLPAFTMGDRGGGLRLRDTMKSDPVEFSNKAFRGAHHVHSDDPAAVQGVLSEWLQAYLAQRPNLCMEAAGANLAIYERDRKLMAEDIRVRFEEGEAILRELQRVQTADK